MSEQTVITLSAASVGFVAAIFLCIGSAMNNAKSIRLQCASFYSFNEYFGRSLVAQRAQYVVGALLLVISFVLQIAATLAFSTNLAVLPPGIHTWFSLVLVVTALFALIGLILAVIVYATTKRKVLLLVAEGWLPPRPSP